MNELNISNEVLLDELGKRIEKGEIKLRGRQFITKSEKGNNYYASYTLKMDIGYLVNTVIDDLKDEIRCLREDKEFQEKRFEEYKKANLKSQ